MKCHDWIVLICLLLFSLPAFASSERLYCSSKFGSYELEGNQSTLAESSLFKMKNANLKFGGFTVLKSGEFSGKIDNNNVNIKGVFLVQADCVITCPPPMAAQVRVTEKGLLNQVHMFVRPNHLRDEVLTSSCEIR